MAKRRRESVETQILMMKYNFYDKFSHYTQSYRLKENSHLKLVQVPKGTISNLKSKGKKDKIMKDPKLEIKDDILIIDDLQIQNVHLP